MGYRSYLSVFVLPLVHLVPTLLRGNADSTLRVPTKAQEVTVQSIVPNRDVDVMVGSGRERYFYMARVEDIVAGMRQNPKGVRFRDLCMVCDFFFGKARQRSSSHRVYKTPWHGDPRINIQRITKGWRKRIK